MGQEITGNLYTKENIENFSENPVPTGPDVSSEVVPDSPFTRVSMSATATIIFTLSSGKASAKASRSGYREASLSIDAQKQEAYSLPVTVRSGLLSAPTPESASVFGGQYGGQYTEPSLLLSA